MQNGFWKFGLLFFLVNINCSFGQAYLGVYQSPDNPYYWKNRPPHQAYWQQDVKYEIEANLNDSLDIIEGNKYKLTYYNNSPYSLNELFFHVNEQAFQPGSYYHDLNVNNRNKVIFGKYEKQGLGTTIENALANGVPAKLIFDNTVLKLQLPTSLSPKDSVIITLQFKTYFDDGGNMRRRMKKYKTFGVKHYDGVHWYPQVAVYDAKFGWTTDQHLDKEFYNNFGSFDVKLTLPQEYILDATGILVNKDIVLPSQLRQRLDIANFKKKPFNEAPSIIVPRELDSSNNLPKTKTWHFYAVNVHNFAFTADPTYRIGEVEWNGIKAVSLVQEPHASKWQASAGFAAKVIEVYSKDFGMYAWPKIIVADANDGMEYPMLTLDGGVYPKHQNLLAHEIGHMWYYGMVGSNETYRAFLDEGFTQYLTVWAIDHIEKPVRKRAHPFPFIESHLDSLVTKYENIYYPYFRTIHEGLDEPLNTHSSAFNGAIRHAGSYGLVYYKTAVMLHNLRYTLSDSLFQSAMKYYFNKWKFCHPYPEDFRQAIIEYTQADLNWFFDEWIETTKETDYTISKVKSTKNKVENGTTTSYTHSIQLNRKGRMQMPIDFTVTDVSGKTYNYHIPNTWFQKAVDSSTTVLPKWYGWDLLKPKYTANIVLSEKIKRVEIDPSLTLADVNRLDNVYLTGARRLGQILLGTADRWQIDHRVPNLERWDKAQNFWRPDVWYNRIDGLQLGLNMNGNYFKNIFQYDLSVWGNTNLGAFKANEQWNNTFKYFFFGQPSTKPVSAHFTYKVSLRKVWKQLYMGGYHIDNAGLNKNGLYFEKKFQRQDGNNPRFTVISVTFDFSKRYNDQYLIYPDLWSYQRANNSVTLRLKRNYKIFGSAGNITLDNRMPSLGSQFGNSYLQYTQLQSFNLSKFEIKARAFARWGFGENPYESALYVSGASPEQMYDSKFYRATAIVNNQSNYNDISNTHFHQGGGLNIRGYYNNDGFEGIISGASFNLEIDFDRFVSIKPKKFTKFFKIDTYLFGDLGTVAAYKVFNYRNIDSFYEPIIDAGFGTAVTIKFIPFNINPLVIRFDMPFYVSEPATNENNWATRYIFGIGRCF